MRFDEVELQPAVLELAAAGEEHTPPMGSVRRILAFMTAVSLFVALGLALSPLLPPSMNWIAVGSLTGFVLLIASYYFAGCWLLWRKTIGATVWGSGL